jgi:peptidoglycan biosynthesis protein MviN/MurJ (putative lipid II flippase)
MAARQPENDWVSPILKLVADLLYFIVFGAFILCQGLTGLLLRYVLNPLFDNVFDRNDGLVVLASALFWMGIGWLCLPLLIRDGTTATELWPLFWKVTLVSLAWGIAIGGWLVLTWWTEVESQSRSSDFTSVTGLSPSFYHSSGSSEGRQLPEPTEDELEGVILGVEWPEQKQ